MRVSRNRSKFPLAMTLLALVFLYIPLIQVTIASFTPAMIAELDPEAFPSLRILDSSGEAASLSVLKKWSSKTVINTYGPTEYTVNACSHIMTDSDTETLPIGRPILNTKFFVQNKKLALLLQ